MTTATTTQIVVEVAYINVTNQLTVSQEVVEVGYTATAQQLSVSQLLAEIAYVYGVSPSAVRVFGPALQ